MSVEWKVGDKVVVPKAGDVIMYENGKPFMRYHDFEVEITKSMYPLPYLVITKKVIATKEHAFLNDINEGDYWYVANYDFVDGKPWPVILRRNVFRAFDLKAY